MLHGGHQQRVDHGHRAAQGFVTLQRILLDEIRHAFEHCVADALAERPRAPCVGSLGLRLGNRAHLLGIFGEPFGSVRTPAEDHVLDPFEQFGLYLAVNPVSYTHLAYINVTFHREGIKQAVRPDGSVEWHVVRRRPGTVGISAAIQKKYDVEVVPHLICGGQSKYDIEDALIDLDFLGLHNVLALRCV